MFVVAQPRLGDSSKQKHRLDSESAEQSPKRPLSRSPGRNAHIVFFFGRQVFPPNPDRARDVANVLT